ncbi:molybdopterin-dependent oxidoreductase [Geminicoccaceae bacterium 1502E]|nr:molybdopterin-dependent oxidoreductase [Geminicoccaceae bacterium 1502E]
MTDTFHPSVCPHDCPSVCALEVEKRPDGRLGKVRGSQRNPFTAGVICAKVARYHERFHHPERLMHPLRRKGAKGSGAFERISWDDALDEVAAGLERAARRHGREAVWPYWYAGTMGLVQRDGINRLTHALGYSRFKSTICVMLSDTGFKAGHGKRWGVPALEIAQHSDLVVVWGCNPVHTHVNMMTHIARARKERGARLVVVDPYRSATAEQADLHLALRPGTDGALACAVMHVLFREGFADREYLARMSDAPEELERHLESRTPEWASAITGLGVETIESFARLYGGTKRAFLRLGYGFTRQRNGAAAMHAASCLPVVTGAWQHAGGGALYNFGELYRWDKTLIEGLDAVDPAVRVLDQSRIGPILAGDADALEGGGPVHALFIQNTNPMCVAPDLGKVHEGFAREDLFVAVHEQFMTDTARMADIVLPATMFLEHDDIYQAAAHSRIQIARKIFEPQGECRSNHEVIAGLARRLGAAHPGFAMSAWELIDDLCRRSGWPDASTIFEAGGWDVVPDFATAHHLEGFPTPDGRFRFRPDWASLGPWHAKMPVLPDHLALIDEVSPQKPFRLVAAPARQFLNSTFTEMPTSRKREGRPTAFLHPDVMAQFGLAEGAAVRLGNERGSVTLHAAPREGQHRDTIVVESIWPNRHWQDGVGINLLLGADPAPPNGGAAVHDTAVWLEAVQDRDAATQAVPALERAPA